MSNKPILLKISIFSTGYSLFCPKIWVLLLIFSLLIFQNECSIKKASAKASANSRRVEEWKSGRSITLPLPGVEEWKIATLPLSEWKSDRPDCPSLPKGPLFQKCFAFILWNEKNSKLSGSPFPPSSDPTSSPCASRRQKLSKSVLTRIQKRPERINETAS